MENQLSLFDQLAADIAIYVAPAKSIVVSDKETQMKAMTSTKEVVSWKKKVEETRKQLIAPLREREREINDYAKKLTEPLVGAEAHLKRELIQWDKKLESERQAELKRIQIEREQKEKEAREAAAKQREEAEAMALFGSTADSKRASLVADAEAERVTTHIAKEARKEEKAVMENKVSGIRSIWKFEVTEIDDVPKKYWIIDESAIGRDVRSGIRDIKGIRIFEEKTMGVR